jgi:hypothetical protein
MWPSLFCSYRAHIPWKDTCAMVIGRPEIWSVGFLPLLIFTYLQFVNCSQCVWCFYGSKENWHALVVKKIKTFTLLYVCEIAQEKLSHPMQIMVTWTQQVDEKTQNLKVIEGSVVHGWSQSDPFFTICATSPNTHTQSTVQEWPTSSLPFHENTSLTNSSI